MNNLDISSMSPPKGSLHQRIIKELWISIALVCIYQIALMERFIYTPFFPNEAAKKGMSQTVYAFVFSMYGFVQLIGSSLCHQYIVPTIGIKKMLILGLTIAGIANFIFGLLNRIDSLPLFTAMCFIVRATESFGCSAFSTSMHALSTLKFFPGDIGKLMSYYCISRGIGSCFGAAFGGMLYTLGGYSTPFLAIGLLQLTMVPIIWVLFKPTKGKRFS